MPPQRRLKVVLAFFILVVVVVFFFTRNVGSSKSLIDAAEDAFYSRTVDALNHKLAPGASPPAPDNADFNDDATGADPDRNGGVQGRLREAAQRARSRANAKSQRPDPPSKVIGQGNAAEGQMPGERSVAGRRKYGGSNPQESPHAETNEEHEVEVTLNGILKKSTIIIFSKSYCPHSRRAKDILLHKYTIEPAPYVVELDEHPIGARLQARLAELTNRRTVPNVLINGVSIGGGDEIASLFEHGTLLEKIQDLGGKKIARIAVAPALAADAVPVHGL